MRTFTKEEIKLARKMRADGLDWNAVARAIGRSSPTGIRRRLDPKFRLRRNAYNTNRMAAGKTYP